MRCLRISTRCLIHPTALACFSRSSQRVLHCSLHPLECLAPSARTVRASNDGLIYRETGSCWVVAQLTHPSLRFFEQKNRKDVKDHKTLEQNKYIVLQVSNLTWLQMSRLTGYWQFLFPAAESFVLLVLFPLHQQTAVCLQLGDA